MRTRSLLVVLALALAACSGGGAATETTDDTAATTAETTATTAAPEATTTMPDASETTGEVTVVESFDDLPGECRDLFVDMLRTIEPQVEDVDFDAVTLEELDALFLEIDPQMTEFDEGMTAAGCDDFAPDVADEQVWQEMLDIADDEAPGTVGFLVWIRDLSQSFDQTLSGEVEGVSGDCDTDTAALLGIAEEGRSMESMTVDELALVGALLTSISTSCTVEQLNEVLENPAVAALIEG